MGTVDTAPAPASRTPGAAGLRWSVRIDGALGGALNMARDHALAASLDDGRAVLRLYRWQAPTLSLGRNEPARGVFDPGVLDAAGVAVVRRPTGGRAVLHWREVTYAVALPLRALGGLRAAYAGVNEALLRGLSFLGVEGDISRGGTPTAPDAGPCFQVPAEGEVVVAGRKLVGSAQARLGGALLQHGSLLLDDDQRRVAALAGRPPGPPPATLRDVLGEAPSCDRVMEAMLEGFRATLPGRWTDDDARAPTRLETELEERYRSDAWTWRR